MFEKPFCVIPFFLFLKTVFERWAGFRFRGQRHSFASGAGREPCGVV